MKTIDFTNDPEVVAVLQKLRDFYTTDKPLVISDVLDDEGHQYVNLVQQGGGVLGIALVGYTYILEQLGVRFLKLAGTSAGAINTMLLASIAPQPGRTKSERVIDYLADLDLFNFVDGHWFARWLIRRLVKSNNSVNRIVKATRWGSLLLLGTLLVGIVCLRIAPTLSFWLLSIGGSVLFALTVLGCFGSYLFRLFQRNGFGLNPGNAFHHKIAQWLKENDVETLADFEAKFQTNAPRSLRMRDGRTESVADLLEPILDWVTLITSDITTQMKIEFPRMWCLYYTTKTAVNPADFVRASMSVPVFFSPFAIRNIPVNDPVVQACWKDLIGHTKPIPSTVQFVDGGVLSNFPINVFYNPKVDEPRMPTLGIRFVDSDPVIGSPKKNDEPNFFSYLWNIFNTARYYYDKDFQLKNNLFEETIGEIDVSGINWLNFKLTDQEKLDLFRRGAKAVQLFLMGEDDS